MVGISSVWRSRIAPGDVVSWRHPNPSIYRREAGRVVAITADTLTVDIVDNAGTYRFEGTAQDFPGLTVDVRAQNERGVR